MAAKPDAEAALVPKLRELARAAIAAGKPMGHLELTLALNPGYRGEASPAMVYRALHAAGFTLDAGGKVVTP